MASRARKLAGKISRELFRLGGEKLEAFSSIRMPLSSARNIIANVLQDERDEDWGHAIVLIELRQTVIEHATALREVIRLLERGKTEGAVARLDGAVTALERASAKQMRDTKATLRREQIKKGKKTR